MINKKIHYCWFGGKALPKNVKKNIDTWKKYCPDYEIIEWNEKNFDINSNIYIKEAYNNKKWAFVTDYVRLKVIYEYGGIYMDTDVELKKNLDCFLSNKAFSGFESSCDIPTGIMACEKKFKLFKEFLDYYDNRHFVKNNGSLDLTTNVSTITNICLKYGLKRNNKFQIINGFALYPNDYFCPKSHITGEIKLTSNTVAIHHFAGSWLSEEAKKRNELRHKLSKLFGVKLSLFVYYTIFLPYIFYSILQEKIKNKI